MEKIILKYFLNDTQLQHETVLFGFTKQDLKPANSKKLEKYINFHLAQYPNLESRKEIYRGNGNTQSISKIDIENLLHNGENFLDIKSQYEDLELDYSLSPSLSPLDKLSLCMEDLKVNNNDIIEFRIYKRTSKV
jgi:hypothetical protein